MKCNPKKLFKSIPFLLKKMLFARKKSTFIISKLSVTGGILLKKDVFEIIISKILCKIKQKIAHFHRKR